MNSDRLYAFWKYDKPPYLLGAEVDERRKNGDIKPKGYGNIWIKFNEIMVIVPYEEGTKMKRELDIAEKEYKKSIDKAKNKLDKRVNKIIKTRKKVTLIDKT